MGVARTALGLLLVVTACGRIGYGLDGTDGGTGDGAVIDPDADVIDPTLYVALAGGNSHGCALRTSGQLVCWGGNLHGQLGTGQTGADPVLPVVVPGVDDAVQLAAGFFYTCVRRAGGRVSCCGINQRGELADGTVMARSSPTETLFTGAVDLATGLEQTWVVDGAGLLFCAGARITDHGGSCETPSWLSAPVPAPVAIAGIGNAIRVSVGTGHACALLQGGSVSCWGLNQCGQIGDGTETFREAPTPVEGLTDAAEIRAGRMMSCAIRTSGAVVCWGDNRFGQLGDGTTVTRARPAAATAYSPAIGLDLGSLHGCALHPGGTVSCRGNDDTGQIGDGPDGGGGDVVDLRDAVAIAVGETYSMALRAAAGAVAWATTRTVSSPTAPPPPATPPPPSASRERIGLRHRVGSIPR